MFEQPLGERPELASAFHRLDDGIARLEAENLWLKAKLEKSEDRRGELMAEINNMYPLLRSAEEQNMRYARELELLAPELPRLQDALQVAEALVEEREMEVRDLKGMLDAAIAARDSARAQVSQGVA